MSFQGEKHFTATMVTEDIRATRVQKGKEWGGKGDEKKKDWTMAAGRIAENVRNGKVEATRVSQIVSYKSKNSHLSCAARTRKSEKCAPLM